jgi:hypothetical protein
MKAKPVKGVGTVIANWRARGRKQGPERAESFPRNTVDAVAWLMEGRWLVNTGFSVVASLIADQVLLTPTEVPGKVVLDEGAVMDLADWQESYKDELWILIK